MNCDGLIDLQRYMVLASVWILGSIRCCSLFGPVTCVVIRRFIPPTPLIRLILTLAYKFAIDVHPFQVGYQHPLRRSGGQLRGIGS